MPNLSIDRCTPTARAGDAAHCVTLTDMWRLNGVVLMIVAHPEFGAGRANAPTPGQPHGCTPVTLRPTPALLHKDRTELVKFVGQVESSDKGFSAKALGQVAQFGPTLVLAQPRRAPTPKMTYTTETPAAA